MYENCNKMYETNQGLMDLGWFYLSSCFPVKNIKHFKTSSKDKLIIRNKT